MTTQVGYDITGCYLDHQGPAPFYDIGRAEYAEAIGYVTASKAMLRAPDGLDAVILGPATLTAVGGPRGIPWGYCKGDPTFTLGEGWWALANVAGAAEPRRR